jgi:arabinogalactan oligomer/maltooligosaccharide transport system substrate-binding protein
MKKKLAAALIAAALTAAMEAGACADELKVWVADNVVSFTQEQIEAFKEANPEFAGYDYVVEPVGEDEAADNMIKDAKTGADIYVFSQDQIARLVAAGALEEVAPDNIEAVESDNDAGASGDSH